MVVIFRPGVKMRRFPPATRLVAAVMRREWTFVEPVGASPIASSTMRSAWVNHRPTIDILKLSRDMQFFPVRNIYLRERVRTYI